MPVLLFVCLALSIPFFNYARYAPLSDWWTDAGAVGLVSLALLCSVVPMWNKAAAGMHKTEASHGVDMPMIGLIGFVWLVYVLFEPYTIGQAAYPLRAGLTVFALAAGVLAHQTLQKISFDRAVMVLAIVILITALLQCILGFTQAVGLAPLAKGYIMFNMDGPKLNIFGNFAQRNQFAHFLSWGIVAACYLYGRQMLKAWLLIACLVVLTLLVAWSGSRMPLAYCAGLAFLTLLWRCRNSADPQLKRFAFAAACAVLLIVLTQIFAEQITHFLQWLGLPLENLGSGAERVMESGFGARRRVEWEKAIQVFKAHPWFGVGIGGFAYQSTWLETLGGYAPVPESSLFAHSHNLVFQLLAETGIVGTAIIGGGIVYCLIPYFYKKNCKIEYLMLISLAMITLGHSMVEYPLWHLPFLVCFMVVLSLSPVRSVHLPVRQTIRRLAAGTLGVFGLFYVAYGAVTFHDVTVWYKSVPPKAEYPQRMASLEQLSRNPLWDYEADFLLCDYIVPSSSQLNEKKALLERLVAYRPYPLPLMKLSVLRLYEGRQVDAENLLLMAIAEYPDAIPTIYKTMDDLHDPTVVPLKDLAGHALIVYAKSGSVAAVEWVVALQKKRGQKY